MHDVRYKTYAYKKSSLDVSLNAVTEKFDEVKIVHIDPDFFTFSYLPKQRVLRPVGHVEECGDDKDINYG